MKIANRTFVVSGGASGLGLGTVRGLLDADARVAILDCAPLAAQDASLADSDRVMIIQIDVRRLDELKRAVERIVEWATRTGAALGGVVNCAGVGMDEPVITAKGKSHSVENWDLHLAVNLTAPFNLSRLVLKHLIRVAPEAGPNPNGGPSDGERGVIILIASTAAYEGMPGTIAYAASKGAIRAMALPMARDCARFGVRVVTLAPGPFSTPMTERWGKQAGGRVDKGMSAANLFPRRYGHPSEFASTVKWILECPYVNGESIRIDGGARLPSRL